MIKVFSGNWRGLGGTGKERGLLLSFEFRKILHYFHGAKLAIFMAIVLHSDEKGVSFPSFTRLERETGYCRQEISKTLDELESLTIEGHRVLLRIRPTSTKGESNRYIIFPTEAEIGMDFGEMETIAESLPPDEATEEDPDFSSNATNTEYDSLGNLVYKIDQGSLQNRPEPSLDSRLQVNPVKLNQLRVEEGADAPSPLSEEKMEGLLQENRTVEETYKKRIAEALRRGNEKHRNSSKVVDAADITSWVPGHLQTIAGAFFNGSGIDKIPIAQRGFYLKGFHDLKEIDCTPEEIAEACQSMQNEGLTIKAPSSIIGTIQSNRGRKKTRSRREKVGDIYR